MPQVHETLSGQRIEYDDPSPAVAKLLKSARAIVDDPKRSSDELVALVYGRGNPILDQTMFPERGAVTKAVLENPVYHVLTDLLARKEAQEKGTNLDRLKARYTLTVADAAGELGISPDAVRRAIRERRLPAWVKDGGAYYVNPEHLQLLGEVGQRGPAAQQAIEYDVGYDATHEVFVRLKMPGGELPFDAQGNTGRVTKWQRVGVLTGGHGKLRFQVIEPGPRESELEFHGFFVKGRFQVVEKVNDAKRARQAWDTFKAS
jgi:Helix-turn-helix domain